MKYVVKSLPILDRATIHKSTKFVKDLMHILALIVQTTDINEGVTYEDY